MSAFVENLIVVSAVAWVLYSIREVWAQNTVAVFIASYCLWYNFNKPVFFYIYVVTTMLICYRILILICARVPDRKSTAVRRKSSYSLDKSSEKGRSVDDDDDWVEERLEFRYDGVNAQLPQMVRIDDLFMYVFILLVILILNVQTYVEVLGWLSWFFGGIYSASYLTVCAMILYLKTTCLMLFSLLKILISNLPELPLWVGQIPPLPQFVKTVLVFWSNALGSTYNTLVYWVGMALLQIKSICGSVVSFIYHIDLQYAVAWTVFTMLISAYFAIANAVGLSKHRAFHAFTPKETVGVLWSLLWIGVTLPLIYAGSAKPIGIVTDTVMILSAATLLISTAPVIITEGHFRKVARGGMGPYDAVLYTKNPKLDRTRITAVLLVWGIVFIMVPSTFVVIDYGLIYMDTILGPHPNLMGVDSLGGMYQECVNEVNYGKSDDPALLNIYDSWFVMLLYCKKAFFINIKLYYTLVCLAGSYGNYITAVGMYRMVMAPEEVVGT